MSYFSVSAPGQTEKVIEKSRFLTYVSHAEGEETARAFLASVRAEHPLATHVCHAFIADKLGNVQRFSDDGEPQGTAGMPILNVIKQRRLYETAVAVVRYFGGIKLGAGGLTRAYASCAAEALEQAAVCLYDRCAQLAILTDYAQVNALLRFVTGRCTVLSRTFEARASLVVAVREAECAAFSAQLSDLLNGRAEIILQKTYFAPFPLEK